MTTPPSDESADATGPVSPPPDAPAPAPTPAPAPAPQPAAAQPPAPPPASAGPPPGYAFAPVSRAPRVPWVNPERRTHVVGLSVAAAIVLLGAGIGIGWAVGGSNDHGYRDGPMMHMRPGYFPGGPGPGYFPRRYPGPREFPATPSYAPAATPSPTATK